MQANKLLVKAKGKTDGEEREIRKSKTTINRSPAIIYAIFLVVKHQNINYKNQTISNSQFLSTKLLTA